MRINWSKPLLKRAKPWIARSGFVLGVALLGAVACFVLFTGPRDLELYPPSATSPYRLPWTAGITRYCVQSNRGVVSHRDDDEFAFDFAMPVGSNVCAARAGIVIRVVDSHDGNGLHAPNNFVTVQHRDGTFGDYLHIKQHGSLVHPGEAVLQGQPIASSGNVGMSMLPHVHFEVQDRSRRTIRASFEDVKEDQGVPRMFKWYTSGNLLRSSQ